ncbi:MAG: CHAT domain-containing protein [Acidobacteria bacterium]|nr:CHAT domain-containing protein [Acidobacteriota bacterium]
MVKDAPDAPALMDLLLESADLDTARTILSEHHGRFDRELVEALRGQVRYLIRSDIPKAALVASMATAAAGMVDDPLATAAGQVATAIVAHRSGRFEDALGHYEAAEREYGLQALAVEVARIARTKIDVLMYLGRFQEALDCAERARIVLARHGDRAAIAQLETNVGNLFHRQDEYRKALEHYDRAHRMFAELNDQFGLAHADLNRANIFVCLTDFNRSLALYRSARERYEALNMELMVVQVDYSVAWLHFLRGRYGDAMSAFAAVKHRAIELGDHPQAALCELDLCEVYLQLNAYDDALESAHSAIEAFGRLKMAYEYAKARVVSGIAHFHRGELESAEDDLLEARGIFEEESNGVYVALVDLHLSDLYVLKKAPEAARTRAEAAGRAFAARQLEGKAAYALLQRARLELTFGDASQAAILALEAAEKAAVSEDRWLKYQTLHLKARTLRQAGNTPAAMRLLGKSIKLIEGMRSSIRVDEFRTGFLKDKLQVYEDAIDLCVREARPWSLKKAFGYVESAKSRTLVDLLTRLIEARPPEWRGGRGELQAQWNALREQLDGLYHRLNQVEPHEGQRSIHVTASLRAGIRVQEEKLARLLRQLQVEDVPFSSIQGAPPASLDAVRSSLAGDEVLVEYFMTGGHIHAFVIGPDAFRLIPRLAERDEVMELLRRLRYQMDKFLLHPSYLQDHSPSMRICIDECLGQLYGRLIEPIEGELEGRRMIFVPHDFLHYLPMHALRSGSDYLIDHGEVSYAPSATVYRLCHQENGPRRERTTCNGLVIGVPDRAAPHITREVDAVRRLIPGSRALLGAEATVAAFLEASTGARYIHLASHALFRHDNPMFSALRLADGWLNFYHLFSLDLNAELVTLSGCRTGVNNVLEGDELVGLARGFLYAGARSLLISLWAVNDQSTAEFMELFYEELGRQESKRGALRSAQLKMKDRYPIPYYWAPFLLTGRP